MESCTQEEAGRAAGPDFWRMRTFAGDVLTFRWDAREENPDSFDDYVPPEAALYDPSVDDYTLSSSEPVATKEFIESGKSQFTLRAPFTGLGTLRVQCTRRCPDYIDPYSFVATVEHKTVLTLARLPRSVKRKKRFRITGTISSPAGDPPGQCFFEPAGGRGGRAVGPVTVVDRRCSARVRAGVGPRIRYRVRFEPTGGWLEDEVTSRKLRVRSS